MWRTSARGRIQFSVENPNTVSQPMSRWHGEAHDAGQVLLALGVAGGPGEPVLPRPAPVAIHDAGDVQPGLRLAAMPLVDALRDSITGRPR